ncbi:hypothetical protein C8R43DRAFT_1127218 [Mycena crocata]|nr:hypothetical protein C8R43DRAFT_1127218 [Mycena crocata]
MPLLAQTPADPQFLSGAQTTFLPRTDLPASLSSSPHLLYLYKYHRIVGACLIAHVSLLLLLMVQHECSPHLASSSVSARHRHPPSSVPPLSLDDSARRRGCAAANERHLGLRGGYGAPPSALPILTPAFVVGAVSAATLHDGPLGPFLSDAPL